MKKNSGILTFFLSIFIFGFLIFKPALSQDASLLPNAVQQFFDSNGNPLSSGKVYFYQVGTSTLKDVYNSSAATTAYTNPITLNAGGKPPGGSGIYGIGLYRQLVKDKNGNTIWDAVTAPGGGGGGTPTGVGDGNAVGTVLPWSGLTAPNQYVFTYGQELIRTSYPEFYSAITLQTNVICTSSSNTLTGIADTTQIPVGAPVELALCVPPGSTVISKTSGTVTLNNPANVSLNATARFFPYGNGNGSTTFNVPDLRDMALIGRPNMGGTDRGLITSQYFGVNPAGLGAVGGVQTATLSVSNLPPYTPTGAVSLSSVDTVYGNLTTGLNIQSGVTNPGAYNPTNLISQMSAVFIGQPQGGTMSPFSLIQPSITFNYIIKVTPDTPMSTETVVTELGGMTGVISCGTGLTCADQTVSVNSFGEATTAIKIPVKAASTVNVALFGPQTIDGISVVAGDRVLIKDQSTASENGIYVVSNSNWTRATDFNEDGEVVQGTQVFVNSGNVNNRLTYTVTSLNPITIGVSNLTFLISPNFTQSNGVSLSWLDNDKKYLDVLQFIPNALWAAIKDGTSTTDVSTYVQTAINTASANNQGVLFPCGLYNIGTSLALPSYAGLKGEGGWCATLKIMSTIGAYAPWVALYPGSPARFLLINTELAGGNTQINIEGFTLNLTDAPAAALTLASHAAFMYNVDKFYFNNNRCIGTTTNNFIGDCISGVKSSNYIVSNNYAYAFSNAAYDNWEGSNNAIITNNICDANNPNIGGTGAGGMCIIVTGANTNNTASTPVYNFTITNNINLNTANGGIWVQGVITDAGAYDITVANNVIDKVNDFHGIRVSEATRVKIIGNTIKNAKFIGILSQGETVTGGCKDCTFTGNTIYNINTGGGDALSGSAILLNAGSNNNIVSSNRIAGTTQTIGVYATTSTSGNQVVNNLIDAGTIGRVADQGTNNAFYGCVDGTCTYYGAGTDISVGSISKTGVMTAFTYQGNSISTTYTDAKIKTVTGTAGRLTISGTSTDPTFNVASTFGCSDLSGASSFCSGTAATDLTAVISGKVLGRASASTGSVEMLEPGIIKPEGRLTLATATPVMTASQSAKTVVYYTPYQGRRVPLYNGVNFYNADTGGELSQATTDATKSPSAVANNSCYNIYVWDDNGTMRATRGVAWATVTTGAAVEMTLTQGIYLNTSTITNGPAALRGTYVGSICSNGTASIDWTFGSAATGGGASSLNVWNYYNRVLVKTMVQETTGSWLGNVTNWQAYNSSTNNRVTYLYGISEDGVSANFTGGISGNASTSCIGIGIDVTTAASGSSACSIGSITLGPNANYTGYPGIGRHYIQALEYGDNATPPTFYGDPGGPLQTALIVNLRM